MKALTRPKKLTPQEIRGEYFSTRLKPRTSLSPTPRTQTDLTPSAKYVAREARKRLGEKSATETLRAPAEDDLFQLVGAIENTEGEELSERERTAVVASLSASLETYDILTPLIENADVNDIIIQSFKDISIQCGRRNVQTDLRFSDHETYKSFVENLLKRVGKACTSATPVVDAAIDSSIRLCVTHESFSPPGSGPFVTLRIARHRSTSLDSLVQFELAPRLILDYLRTVIRDARATILIGGEVGTGKTTLARALVQGIDPEEAILTIEDTHELALDRPFVRTLLTREANTEGAGRITPAQAIRTSMRMAMNRIVLGEMRDSEAAEAFIDVCASGHAGISTIHARSARDVIARLELFLSRAQAGVSVETIRRQIANAVSVIIYLAVDSTERKRRIIEVLEVGSSSDGAVQVAPMFTFGANESFAEWKRGPGVSQFLPQLLKSGVRLGNAGDIYSLDPELMYRGSRIHPVIGTA